MNDNLSQNGSQYRWRVEDSTRTLLCAVALLGMLALPAQAQDIQAGIGLVCDTQAQVERFIKVVEGDPKAALEQVNAEAGQNDACIIAGIYFLPGEHVSTVNNPQGTFQVVPVLVLGVQTPHGPRRFAEPVKWFTVVKLQET